MVPSRDVQGGGVGLGGGGLLTGRLGWGHLRES